MDSKLKCVFKQPEENSRGGAGGAAAAGSDDVNASSSSDFHSRAAIPPSPKVRAIIVFKQG